MKSSEMIKQIRSYLNLSQMELAEKTGVSFATVNRWENGHCEPSPVSMDAIRDLCNIHNVDIAQFEGNHIISTDEILKLYHGSGYGIRGEIRPSSRRGCDFGKGFYMCGNRDQALALVCSYPEAKLYTLCANLSGLKVFDLEVGLDWALLIAYHWGKMESIKGTPVYQRYCNMAKDCDMISGFMTNDGMFVILNRFFNGEITDRALFYSLLAMNLNKQYVALTEKACRQIQIYGEEGFSEEEKDLLIDRYGTERGESLTRADEICRKYRREGKYFDEIIMMDE